MWCWFAMCYDPPKWQLEREHKSEREIMLNYRTKCVNTYIYHIHIPYICHYWRNRPIDPDEILWTSGHFWMPSTDLYTRLLLIGSLYHFALLENTSYALDSTEQVEGNILFLMIFFASSHFFRFDFDSPYCTFELGAFFWNQSSVTGGVCMSLIKKTAVQFYAPWVHNLVFYKDTGY